MKLKRWISIGICMIGAFLYTNNAYASDSSQAEIVLQEDAGPAILCDEVDIVPLHCEYTKNKKLEFVIYDLKTELTNKSAQDIMEIKYQIRFFDENGTEVYYGWEIYNGQDTPIAPGQTVISERAGRIETPEKPASVEVQVLEVFSAKEVPPIHRPQEGELLIDAFSDEHMKQIAENYPIKVEMRIDRMGSQSVASITDEKTMEKVVNAFSKIRIGKETQEEVTDNYNGLAFYFDDDTQVNISLNYKNLEFPIYHECQLNELENFGEFWNLMNELVK